jgi:hypothetical protein
MCSRVTRRGTRRASGRELALKLWTASAETTDVRRLATPVLLAVFFSVAYGWSQLTGYAWTDYELANEVQYRGLVHGDFATFFQLAAIEGPSLLLRSPFAFASWLWGGSDMAIYRLVAVPGLVAGAVLAVVLWELRARLQPGAGWGLAVVLLAAANPLTLRALDIGHPEELLGAALCVGAVLAALWKRPYLAALLLGLALANKAWAVLAVGPVLLALDSHRWRVLLIAGAIGAAFVVPFLLAGATARSGVVGAAAHTGGVWQPWQLWWPLGEEGQIVRGFDGVAKPDWRAAPAWIGPLTHPLIAMLVIPASLLWRRRHGAAAASADVFLLLALLFLARCVLDPANNVYYHLPFVMSLLTWEALRHARPPVFTTVATCLIWATLELTRGRITPDVQWVLYMAWALPALLGLAWAAFGAAPARGARLARPAPRVQAGSSANA